jgi:hypothetical protein
LRILLVDIETAPNISYVWGLWDQNISHEQLVESSYILCWSAKWLGEKKVYFESAEKQTRLGVLTPIHALLGDADVVIHFNGTKFDIPILNREFVKQGLPPPAPYKQIDLLRVVKRAFRFESNKLAYITQALGLQGKVKHEGFQLWVGCMNGEKASWRTMEKYNRNDVAILEPLYTRLLPWIGNHPLRNQGLACTRCGSTKTQRRGVQVAKTQVYVRLQCQECGGWFRSNKVLVRDKEERGVNIAV